ncbi:MAG TPA: Gfo/Idh/MocA family oxidoreductase [Rugosimonospora sp.]|nr:Gfo/Idh/MocA family oxidoreductase [Rugosimonospora sp.]
MGRLGSAVVGTGFIGRVHARAVLAAGGDLVAVAASSREAACSAAGEMHARRGTGEWRELVRDPDVDVIHVCTPNDLHAEIAMAALAAGKHVVCEKPLATGIDQARAMQQEADRSGAVAAVPFAYRFYPTVRDARARLRRGDAGRLRLMHGTYLQDWLSRPGEGNWRTDPVRGGPSRAFADIGVHWCDLAEFVTGQRIARLSARLFTVERNGHRSGTEDGAAVMFETGEGVLGSVVVSQVSPGRKNRLWFSLDGETASLQFDQENPDSLWIGGREHDVVVPRAAESSTVDANRYSTVPAGHPMGYQDCFTAFVADVYATIRGEKVDGLPTFADGLRAAVITDTVLEASKTSTWVEVPG